MSWETFQSVCRDKLDLLIRFSYGEEASRRQQTKEIQGFQTRFGFNISKTVRVDSGMLRSVESFLDKAQATQTDYVSLNEYINIHMNKIGRVVETPMN